MRKIFLLGFVMVVSFAGYAQELPRGRYVFSQFKTGIGKMKVGLPVSDFFNYDQVKQEMHFMSRGEEMLLDMPMLDTLFIDKRVFVQRAGKFAECFKLQNGMDLEVFWHAREQEKGKKGANGISTQAGGVYNIYVGDYTGEHAYQDTQLEDLGTYRYIPQNIYVVRVKGKNRKFTDAKSFAKAFGLKEDDVKAVMKENNWYFSDARNVVSLLESMEIE